MKSIFSLLILCVCALAAFSQQRVVITILNDSTKRPVEAASVAFAGAGSFTANPEGQLVLPAATLSKITSVTVTATGYQPSVQTLLPATTSISIYLKPLAAVLQPVEVNAVRAGERSPFAKTNLNRAYMEKNNLGQDLPFLLNQTPSVVVNSDAGNGVGYTGIRIRGTDATRINTTINGLPYNDAESQGTYFVDLPDFASSVSSVQIQRGVGTSSNGAGAFGASINFSTNDYRPDAYVDLNNSYGSFNTWKNTVRAGSGLLGKHFTIEGRLSNLTSDGYIDRATSNLQSAYGSIAYWGKKTSLRFNVIVGKEKTYQAWNGVPQDSLKTHRTYNSVGTERPGSPYENETDNYWQKHFQLFWNQQLGRTWSFNTALFLTPGKGYYEQYKAGETLSDYGIAPFVHGTDTVASTDLTRRLWLKNYFFGQIFSFQQKGAKHQFTLGGGANRYLGDHFGEVIWTQAQPGFYNKYYSNFANKSDVNVYAKWQQQVGRHLDLFADVQYRYVHYRINGFDANPGLIIDNDYHFINPKGGVSYRSGNWSGFASYALANKEPNRNDFEAGAAQQPKYEQLHDFELNIRRSNIVTGLTLGATGYYMLYRNQLVQNGRINDVGAYTRINIPKSYRAGVEVEANYQSRIWNAYYSLGLSQNKVKNFTEYVDVYDDNFNWTGQQPIARGNTTIAFSPSVVQNLTVNVLPVKDLELSWLGKQVGRQYLDNTGDVARRLDAYLVNDVRVAYNLHFRWAKNIRLVFQVNNVFNEQYEPNGYTFSYLYGGQYTYENYYFPMAGTNFLAAVNISF
jgi:iron complex outermembrane recepter protein